MVVEQLMAYDHPFLLCVYGEQSTTVSNADMLGLVPGQLVADNHYT